ncbi:MAG: SDR family oxidoreductase [Chitinispirillales bacterium]|jgi:NAD(P)-dependent dehydrogenase (short-subunit alcohol dehydrogenase family)|nr:SDR family oxidoreductase [Chitinispirillales bacterium]
MDANKEQCQRTAVITGASDRIGFELAKECLDLGYYAVIHYRTSPEPAASVFSGDGRVAFIQADLTESPEKFIADVKKLRVPPLAGLINNASLFEAGDMSAPDHFDRTLTVNALTPLRLSAAFAKSAGSGWIINITDAHIRSKSRKYQNYRVSKLFLEEITRQQACLYAPAIRVNAIAPGAILPAAGETRESFDYLIKNIPMNRTGAPAHIRQALRFLVENDYVTGSVIPIDGGLGL